MRTNKEPVSDSREQNQQCFIKGNRFLNLSNVSTFLICSTCLLVAVSLHFAYPGSLRNLSWNQESTGSTFRLRKSNERCDLFKGQWIPDTRGPLYTNYTCTTMLTYQNCFLHGRNDTDFLYWRWKPDHCELPRFDPKEFLSNVRGKTLGFIGDSVARNHMESLLCLLSVTETPVQAYKEGKDEVVTWKFPQHNFTLKSMIAIYLVASNPRKMENGTVITGSFNMHLDKADTSWVEILPSLDYAVISNGHWYFRSNYLYENGNFLGCTYCKEPNVTNMGTLISLRKAFRTAFKTINKCTNCKNTRIMIRTYAPEHFQGGAWNKGGGCDKTRPYTKEEILEWRDIKLRNIQVEELDRARKEGGKNGIAIDIVDVTEMMLMRPDGHPGRYYGKHWLTGYKDCLHWCLPGPIDTWNELLLETIKSPSI